LSFTLFLCKNYTTHVYTLPRKVTNLNYHQVYVLNHLHIKKSGSWYITSSVNIGWQRLLCHVVGLLFSGSRLGLLLVHQEVVGSLASEQTVLKQIYKKT